MKIVVENNGKRLAKQLISLITNNGNNYQDTHIEVCVSEKGVTVSTVCVNQYGTPWYNNNDTFVPKAQVPYFTAKKLGLV